MLRLHCRHVHRGDLAKYRINVRLGRLEVHRLQVLLIRLGLLIILVLVLKLTDEGGQFVVVFSPQSLLVPLRLLRDLTDLLALSLHLTLLVACSLLFALIVVLVADVDLLAALHVLAADVDALAALEGVWVVVWVLVLLVMV